MLPPESWLLSVNVLLIIPKKELVMFKVPASGAVLLINVQLVILNED